MVLMGYMLVTALCMVFTDSENIPSHLAVFALVLVLDLVVLGLMLWR